MLKHFQPCFSIRRTEKFHLSCPIWINWHPLLGLSRVPHGYLIELAKDADQREIKTKPLAAHNIQGSHMVKERGKRIANTVVLVEYLLCLELQDTHGWTLWFQWCLWVNVIRPEGHLLNRIQVTDLRNGPTFEIPRTNITSNCTTF